MLQDRRYMRTKSKIDAVRRKSFGHPAAGPSTRGATDLAPWDRRRNEGSGPAVNRCFPEGILSVLIALLSSSGSSFCACALSYRNETQGPHRQAKPPNLATIPET